MSATLVVAIPLALLGVVALLGFVGCGFSTVGVPPDFTDYRNTTVLGTPGVMAFWPLSDGANSTKATELVANNQGDYINMGTAPAGFYPWPSSTLGTLTSADAPGDFALAQPGLVTGDFVNNSTATCMVVNGALVKVDLIDKTKINPAASFTIEAWVQVQWKSSDTFAPRTVIDARDSAPVGTGFGLHATVDPSTPGVYHWEAVVGNGGSGTDVFTVLTSPNAITLAGPESFPESVYLAVTYDNPSQTLILFVDGQEVIKIVTPYVQNTTQPLLIGAAAPFLPERPQPPGVVAGPLFPWVGAIQDVAIYDVALDGAVITTHFDQGHGNNT